MTLAVDIPNPLDGAGSAVGDLLGGVAGDVGKAALDAVLSWFASSLADACRTVATELFHFMAASSTVNLDTGWWAGPRAQALLATVGQIALALLLLFVLLAVVQGVLNGDPAAVVRTVVREVPVAMFGFVATVTVASVLLKVTDAASAAVLSDSPDSLARFLGGFGEASNALSGGLLAMMLFGLFLVGALLVWIELTVRSSLLYLLLALSSLALAARVWPPARGMWRRLCELGVALIASKFVIALALALGLAALGGGGPNTGDIGTQAGVDAAGLLTGATLMLLAGFSPFVLLKLVPVAEAALVAQGISRSPVRAVGSAALTTSSVANVGRSLGGGGSVASGAAIAPAAPVVAAGAVAGHAASVPAKVGAAARPSSRPVGAGES